MKKLYLIVVSTLLAGCPHPPNSKTISSLDNCSESPVTSLEAKNVKTVSLNTQDLKESGIAYLNSSIGFTFDAQTGQDFTYSTNGNICIWVYTPDNQILRSSTLPRDGKYIVQISALKGQTTFDLSMKLTASKNPSGQQQSKKNIDYAKEQIDKTTVTPTPVTPPPITTPPVSDAPIPSEEPAAYQPPVYQDTPSYSTPLEEVPTQYYSDSPEEAPTSRPAPPPGRDAN